MDQLCAEEFARDLMQSGTRYVLCAGTKAKENKFVFDDQYVKEKLKNRETLYFVMTTQHEREVIPEIVWFTSNCTSIYDEQDRYIEVDDLFIITENKKTLRRYRQAFTNQKKDIEQKEQ